MNRQLKSIFDNSWIELVARWILGVTFIYASYHKIPAPAEFAKIVYGYDLFPGVSINLIAIILPFVELFSGVALIVGIYPRSAALIVNGVLLAFIIALSINLVRGHEFDCGCFSLYASEDSVSSGEVVVRDIVCLVLGLHVFLYSNPRRSCIGGRI